MSTETLKRGESLFFALYRQSWARELPSITQFKRSTQTGNLHVTDMPVFRSGSFRDSWGDLSTWDPMHMDQMVSYFDMLRNRHVFENVPVRDQHKSIFGAGGEVVGWHTGLRTEELENQVDGAKYTYLLASYEITEPDAQGKIERGTWRNRSSEIGKYRTNDEAEYWPVYMGFAFVDMPAVEGLNGFAQDQQRPEAKFTLLMDKELNVTAPTQQQNAQPPAQQTPPVTPPAQAPPAQQAPDQQQHAAPQAPAQQAAPVQLPAQIQSHSFTINGQPTTDFAAVQAHITSLETTISEARTAGRNDFVDSLAKDNKILAGEDNLKDTKAFANGLNDEQFIAWKKQWEAAPALPQLQNHAGTVRPGTAGAPAQVHAANQEIEDAQEVVRRFRSINRPESEIKQTPSYKKLVAAGIEQA